MQFQTPDQAIRLTNSDFRAIIPGTIRQTLDPPAKQNPIFATTRPTVYAHAPVLFQVLGGQVHYFFLSGFRKASTLEPTTIPKSPPPVGLFDMPWDLALAWPVLGRCHVSSIEVIYRIQMDLI